VQRRRVDPHEPMGGAVDQVVELYGLAALRAPELVADVVQRALYLVHDVLGPVGVVGDQPVLRLLERSVLCSISRALPARLTTTKSSSPNTVSLGHSRVQWTP
jgi:hypothetical protein